MNVCVDHIKLIIGYIVKELRNDNLDNVSKLNDILSMMNHHKKMEKNKNLKTAEPNDYENFDNKIIIKNFKDRGLKVPNIADLKYKLKFESHNKFANGDSTQDYCNEILDIIYKINNKWHNIYLEIEYDCCVSGHSGGVEDYEVIVKKFKHTGNDVYNCITVADAIMSAKSRVLRSSRYEEIYTAIEKFLKLIHFKF